MTEETRFEDIPAIPEVQLPSAPCATRPARSETLIGRYSVGVSACIGAIALRKTTESPDRQLLTRVEASMVRALVSPEATADSDA